MTPAPRVALRRLRTLLAGLLAVSLAACSINPPLELAALSRGQPARQLASVPFYPQTDYQCGPAALAGVLAAAGLDTDPPALSAQVYLPGRQGSLQAELLVATRRAGRIPYVLQGEPGALLAQLDAGRPALVLQNLRTRQFPVWHYAVLVGYDAPANQFFLNSGMQRGLAMPAPAFLRSWDWAGRWAMVVLRPGELPGGATPAGYAEAVAAFEAVAGLAAAAPAWRAALAAWPRDPRPYLALGNLAYSGGELVVALDYFRRGLGYNGGAPALANNLAAVLGELGCPQAGSAVLAPVRSGLAGDSAWRPVLAATLAELAALPQAASGWCAALYPGAVAPVE